jgi:hypothetical protein
MAITFGKKNPVASFIEGLPSPGSRRPPGDGTQKPALGNRGLPHQREIHAAGTGHFRLYNLILKHMGKNCFFAGFVFEF